MATNSESLLLSAAMNTGEITTISTHGVRSDYFESYGDVYDWLVKFEKKNHQLPSWSTLKNAYPEFPKSSKVVEVEHFCDEVRNDYKRRLVLMMTEEILDVVEEDVDQAVEVISTRLKDIQTTSSEGWSGDFDLFSDWNVIFDHVEGRVAQHQKTGSAGVPTGFKTLDDVTGGLQEGWLGIVLARAGQGKTWALAKMAWEATRHGYSSMFLSLEQSRNQIGTRVHSLASAANGQVFKSNDLSRGFGFDVGDYLDFLKSLAADVDAPLIIQDTSQGPIDIPMVASLIERNAPDIVFIDYLTLLKTGSGSSNYGQHDWQAISELSTELKRTAERYAIPIIAAAQANRQGVGKENPKVEHIAGADRIGQDADLAVSVKQMSTHCVRMDLVKFRHGPDGKVWDCEFRPGAGIFKQVSPDRAQEIIADDKDVD